MMLVHEYGFFAIVDDACARARVLCYKWMMLKLVYGFSAWWMMLVGVHGFSIAVADCVYVARISGFVECCFSCRGRPMPPSERSAVNVSHL